MNFSELSKKIVDKRIFLTIITIITLIYTAWSVYKELVVAKRKSKEIRKKEILDAALQCFSKKGYDATTLDDIVTESGLSKGAIYWYFKGKRELFMTLVERHLQEDRSLWGKLLEEHEVGPDFLTVTGPPYLKRYFEDKWVAPLFAEFMAEAYRDKKLKGKIDEFREEWRERIKGAFDQALKEGKVKDFDSDTLSRIFVAFMEGVESQYWVSGKKLDYKKV